MKSAKRRSTRSAYRATVLRIAQVAFIVSFMLCFYSSYRKGALPDAHLIDRALLREPRQQETARRPFLFSHYDHRYRIEPVAEYELWGLVVSHNDIHSLFDAYHTWKSVDVKDLCVLWGSNVIDNNFKKVKFWSEAWTCNFSTNENEVYDQFAPDKISNNHLLASDRQVLKKIREVAVGDQIYLRGALINYSDSSASEQVRSTSLVRDDTGCEVIFVDELRTIKRNNAFWHSLFRYSYWSTWILGIVSIVIWLSDVYRAAYR